MSESSPTFASFQARWRAELPQTVGRSTAAEYVEQYERHIRPTFAARPLGSVVRGDIDEWLRHLLGAGHHPNTIAIALCAMRHIFRTAVRLEVMRESPAYGLQTRLRRIQVSREPIPAGDIAPIVERVRRWRPTFADIIALNSQVGARIGETLALRVMDADGDSVLVRRTWHDEGWIGETKNREARRVPLTVEAQGIVDRHTTGKGRADWLFGNPETGAPFQAQTVRKWFRRALDELHLPRAYKVHCLRHSFGTELVSAGIPESLVGRYLGQRDHRITRGYTRQAKPPRPPAFDQALRFLHGAVRQPPQKALRAPHLRLVRRDLPR